MYNRKYTDDELAKLLAVWNDETNNNDTLEEFKMRVAEWQLEQVHARLKQRAIEMDGGLSVSDVVERVRPKPKDEKEDKEAK